jgi:putative DNA primase/helicase
VSGAASGVGTEQQLEWYANEGWKLVRLSRETKKPVDKDWQNRNIPHQNQVDWVARGGNVGIQVGAVSDWINAVDPDCPEAVTLAPVFLPDTLKSQKGEEPPSLYIYRSPGLGFVKFQDLDGETIMDLKASRDGAGHQVAVEPSIHPNKGPYRWIGGFNPAAIAEVTKEELRAKVGMLAVAALISRNLPNSGRHDLAMALSGYLLRNGVSSEDVLEMLLAAWEVRNAPRDGLRDLEAIVRNTKARIDKNEPATGGRTLEELIPGMPSKIAKFLGWERADSRELRRHYERSDLGNAERFLDLHGNRVRWCPARKMWLFYDGKRWRWDECGEVLKFAQVTARSIYKDAEAEPDPAKQREIAKFAISSQNEGRINGMLSQAKPHVAVRLEELDADPWVINCQNGTLDLRTGKLKPNDPADQITKIVPVDYAPDADCPRFKDFLREVLIDTAVINFMRRYSGYTLTGVTRERLFAILHGPGKNGKTTLVELLQDVLGDYATNTDTETILAKKYQGVGNDVAALRGARFVSAAEVEQGRRLAESKVKQLTGNDTITARYLFGEPFNFRPQFKLWLSTNNKPVIKGTDDAIWDRIRLVPFTQRFEGSRQDPKLPEKLREELTGVFAWMVSGCLEWQEHGLGEPESVRSATNQYREEMDTLATFIDENCVVRAEAYVLSERLYQQYSIWCDNSGERKEPQKGFVARLSERGFERKRATAGVNRGRYIWRGIGLLNDENPPDGNDKGSRREPSENVGSQQESRKDKPNSASSQASREPSEPKNQNHHEDRPREKEDSDFGFTGFTGFTQQKDPHEYRRSKGPANGLSLRNVLAEFSRSGSGPAKTAATYLAGETKLEYVVRSVLFARGIDTEGWRRYEPVVEEALEEWGRQNA